MNILNISFRRKGILSSFTLKCIAIISMVVDHIGVLLVSESANVPWRIVGRIAFPIFCFLIVEGYFHTKDIKKYFLRLATFAFVSEIPFDKVFFHSFFDLQHQSVLITFCIGLLALVSIDHSKALSTRVYHYFSKSDKTDGPGYMAIDIVIKATIVLTFCGAIILTKSNYGLLGLATLLAFFIFRNKPISLTIAVITINLFRTSYLQPFACLAMIPILLYNGERGSRIKYAFYMFYPVHIIVISLFVITPLSGAGIITPENQTAAFKQVEGLSETIVDVRNGDGTLESSLILPENINTIMADSIVNITTINNINTYNIPDFFISNGYMVAFSRDTNNGWTLNKGDTLTLSFLIDLEHMGNFYKDGVSVVIGYIANGKYFEDRVEKEIDFQYTLIAPEEGEYYLCITNASSEKAIVIDGIIETKSAGRK